MSGTATLYTSDELSQYRAVSFWAAHSWALARLVVMTPYRPTVAAARLPKTHRSALTIPIWQEWRARHVFAGLHDSATHGAREDGVHVDNADRGTAAALRRATPGHWRVQCGF